MKKIFLILLFSIPFLGFSEQISYELSMPSPHTHLFEVTMKIEDIAKDEIEVYMPVWTPGSYKIRDFSKNVDQLSASSGANEIQVEKTSKNTWKLKNVKKKTIEISYQVYAFELSVRTSFLDMSHGYINGASVFLTARGMENLPLEVNINPYTGWDKVSTGLTHKGDFTYSAENFDQLVDSPIEIGNHDVYTFIQDDTEYEVAIFGKSEFGHSEIVEGIETIVATTNKIMEELPIKKYTFIIHNLEQGSGGLEHANSTSLQVSRWRYESMDSFLGLVAHEYFHLWNVKRIRPQTLDSFNYDKENYTNTLWIMEGFTSYYQELILLNSEVIDIQRFLGKFQSSINYIESQPGIEVQSLAESSFDAWIKQYQPNENSLNTTVSYYTKGKIVALLLDLEIIQSTEGKNNLDDLMNYIYREYYKKKNRGFTEKEFQDAASLIAGKDLTKFFNNYVYSTEPLDYKSYFAYTGIDVFETYPNQLDFGAKTSRSSGKMLVKSVTRGGSAYNSGINVNDEIIGVDGYRINGKELNSIISKKEKGDTVEVIVARDGLILKIPVELQPLKRRKIQLSATRELSKDERKIFRKWIRIEDES